MNIFNRGHKRLQCVEPSRLQRRMAVVAFFSSYFFVSLSMFAPTNPALQLFEGFGLITGPFCMVLLLFWALPLINQKTADERQKARRNEMYTAAYRVVGFSTIIFWLVVAAVEGFYPIYFRSLLGQPDVLIRGYGFAVIPFVALLPIAMLAWLEPNPIADESLTTQPSGQGSF